MMHHPEYAPDKVFSAIPHLPLSYIRVSDEIRKDVGCGEGERYTSVRQLPGHFAEMNHFAVSGYNEFFSQDSTGFCEEFPVSIWRYAIVAELFRAGKDDALQQKAVFSFFGSTLPPPY